MPFAIYSTDIAATTQPATASPAPAQLLVFDQDPIYGEYDPEAGVDGRGAVIETLGAPVVQEFAAIAGDGRIRVAEENALGETSASALRSIYQSGGERFFTDGYRVWRVRFARPDGCKLRLNLLFRAHGTTIYSYECNLVVIAREI